ncbi:MAG: (2Fe-2S)-binding protein [Alphaproteobacteria bacterium]|nr:(2Fe-2S)-binding protein [Alphaproteobacteria bacterium]
MAFTITINGKAMSLDVPEDMPLLWVLRDELGITGPKYGCGQGLCGACTVHVDGLAVRSCITTAAEVEGAEVTTLEGLSGPAADALRTVWAADNVAQCGYCQGGQIMSAAALLEDNASPEDDDIDAAMSGNICRCGTYGRIRCAIKKAAKTLIV